MYLTFALGRTSSVIMGNKPALSLEAVGLTYQVICSKMVLWCMLHQERGKGSTCCKPAPGGVGDAMS